MTVMVAILLGIRVYHHFTGVIVMMKLHYRTNDNLDSANE